MKRSILYLPFIGILSLFATACGAISAPEPTATPEPTDKILFVGNSFTYWSNGPDLVQ